MSGQSDLWNERKNKYKNYEVIKNNKKYKDYESAQPTLTGNH